MPKMVEVKRYRQFADIIETMQPQTIIEIGVAQGHNAVSLCIAALRHHETVHYIGYDLFERSFKTDKDEKNNKSVATEEEIAEKLRAIPGLTFELVKGDTRKTLHGTEQSADLVFIDGGHSVETIRGDYEAVKNSSVIVFDDYYTSGVDTEKFGCNKIVENLPHELLSREDRNNGAAIRMAVVGYSSKWADALKRVREHDAGVRSIAIWRPGFKRRVDLIAAINCLEPLMEPQDTLEELRVLAKRMFFVIKADALRGLPWWRAQIELKFQIHEWFGNINEHDGPSTEVCGTASKLYIVGELQAKGVVAEDERFENCKANIVKVKKRLINVPEEHDRTALIVCYGPSLNDTWTDIIGHLKFKGGDVFSVSGAHDFLLRRNIIPKYHVECDPRPHKADNLNRPAQGVEYLIASCCHPNLVDKLLPYDVTLWHMANGEESFRTIDELEPDQFMVHGGGNAGLRSIAVAYVMGYRDFVIYGMDCSFKGDREWAGPHVGKKKNNRIEVVCDGQKFQTSSVMVSYARHFVSTVEHAPGATFTLVGDGLLQTMIREGNRVFKKEAAA